MEVDKHYKRGQIYYAYLDHGRGSEQHGLRPVLVIQNNTGNHFSPTTIIASITRKPNEKDILPTHIRVTPSSANGLCESSVVMLEQIQTVDTSRLLNYIGHLEKEYMLSVDKAIAISLGISPLYRNTKHSAYERIIV